MSRAGGPHVAIPDEAVLDLMKPGEWISTPDLYVRFGLAGHDRSLQWLLTRMRALQSRERVVDNGKNGSAGLRWSKL